MTLNRTSLFIAISSFALLMVLCIQVNWMVQTAKIKEDLFNEKANMVLTKTTEALGTDKVMCGKIEACMEPDGTSTLGQTEIQKIDSLLRYYMEDYNIHLKYSFVIIKPGKTPTKSNLTDALFPDRPRINKKSFNEVFNENGLELNVVFPNKRQFIIAEMGPLFIGSVILILVVLILFWRTVLALHNEKKISEHTTDFLNNMTHEFKTPLTNIALAGKMLIKDSTFKQEDKLRHYSGIILAENEKLRLQVEHVLSMTALERGEIPLQKTTLDVHQLINDSLKCIGVQIENKNGNIYIQPNASNVMIFGDKSHLTNALCNLIDNAIKYSNVQPELSISTRNTGNNIIIEVSDKGIGIAKVYQQKVFDKFFRIPTGDVHDVKGFGLGLSYVKKIIELHEGAISLKSEIGKGATFIITLRNA